MPAGIDLTSLFETSRESYLSVSDAGLQSWLACNTANLSSTPLLSPIEAQGRVFRHISLDSARIRSAYLWSLIDDTPSPSTTDRAHLLLVNTSTDLELPTVRYRKHRAATGGRLWLSSTIIQASKKSDAVDALYVMHAGASSNPWITAAWRPGAC